MKSRLTTHDIVVLVHELREKLLGLRVDQVYDIDKKSYLIRFTKTNTKKVLFIESGCRFHTTQHEWPKNPAPSGFTMKMRKHLSNKRLENISQVGVDRVVDFHFGMDAFEFHIFLELYDKGNIILTDQSFTILSLVRPHVQGEDKIAPHQKYATDKAKTSFSLSHDDMEVLMASNPGKTLRETFLSKIEFGPSLFSYVLKDEGFALSTKIPKLEDAEQSSFGEKLFRCLERGRIILESEIQSGGFITMDSKSMKKMASPPSSAVANKPNETSFVMYDQFHPALLLSNFDEAETIPFPTLDDAVDEFFSKIEAQKIELKQKTQERDAYGRLEYMKMDQKKRLDELQHVQEVDKGKAELIMFNQEAIEQAIAIMRQLIANQLSWDDIWEQIKEAQKAGDALAQQITALNLIKNQITMKLKDPYETDEAREGITVDIHLDLSAYANATKYFDLKRASARKEERTLEAQEKAFKSTEKKTMSSLREVAAIQSIKKVRKAFWFEKFRWFISSENYLVLAGQDAQQNELLVKRYLKPTDVYLHADSHGAPTVIIKNDTAPGPVLPKTLNEAGTLAVCASHAWEDKIIPAVWWVWGDQVSKSAPTGEYLPTGSFMIRGKKNFLPPSQLVMGFGFLFRLTDESIPRHANERSRRVQTSSIGEDSIPAISRQEAKSIPEPETVDSSGSESESEDSNEGEGECFPDTKVEIELKDIPGPSRVRTESTMSSNSVGGRESYVEDGVGEGTVIIAGVQPGFLSTDLLMKSKQKLKRKEKEAKKKQKGMPKQTPIVEQPVEPVLPTGNKPKRGQHGRQKKLKEKYRFQDDEERELRMQLLQAKPKGNEIPSLDGLVLGKIEESADTTTESGADKAKRLITTSKSEKQQPVAGALEDEEQIEVPEMETNVLNTLTGAPLEEDELLFAIPVIAPYASLQNYKFRIKMIPGTTKRGKAARNAFESFLRDKSTKPREKDLLKSVKDQDLSRQFPGRVKLAGGVDKK